jgi:hypothetical protein
LHTSATTPFNWQHPNCYGVRPKPRAYCGYTQIASTGYLFGGSSLTEDLDELYTIDLLTYTWRKIETDNGPSAIFRQIASSRPHKSCKMDEKLMK